jgi:hypothetical protein
MPRDTPQEEANFEYISGMVLAIYLTVFLMFGQCFSGGMFATIPMGDKKGGLRQMLHIVGVSPTQYQMGMYLSDCSL